MANAPRRRKKRANSQSLKRGIFNRLARRSSFWPDSLSGGYPSIPPLNIESLTKHSLTCDFGPNDLHRRDIPPYLIFKAHQGLCIVEEILNAEFSFEGELVDFDR